MLRMNKNRMNITAMHQRKKRGYTLGEMLAVVLIIVILFAIAVPSVLSIQKHLRQAELDAKAETIYVAVQNKLSKMMASGSTDCLQVSAGTGVVSLPDIPNDADPEVDEIRAGDIAYFTSADLNASGSAAYEVMNDASLEASLVDEHWVVEFNPTSAIVYAVFYSEDRADCSSEYESMYSTYDTSYRYKDGRLDGGAKVGYYGGGTADSGSQVTEISPTLTVENAEKLTAQIKCTIPSGISDEPVFKIEMEDMAGNKYTAYYAYWAVSSDYQTKIRQEAGSSDLFMSGTDKEKIEKSGRTYTLNLTLDDLTDQNTRFVSLYGADSNHTTKLLSGTPLKITVTAMCPGNKKITGTHSATVITNSLFADNNCTASGDELNKEYGSDAENAAVITCGRHLQNLDTSSGIVSSVRYAVQGNNIDFSEDKDQSGIYDWYETYALSAEAGTSYFNGYCADNVTPAFKPIKNSTLEKFSGETADISYAIAHLSEYTTSASSAMGLFSTLSDGQRVVGVTMTGTSVIAKGRNTSAGAIAGTVTGNASIENCQVYLAIEDTKGRSNQDVWISGKAAAGGLVGTVSGGTLTIEQSSAATVIGTYKYNSDSNTITSYDVASVGGLVGSVASGSTVSLTESFADSYLVGKNAGGLIGTSKGSVSAQSCFAAGFLSWNSEAAGLIDGAAASLQNCYTIMSPLYQANDTYTYYSTAKTGTVSGTVYYSFAYSDSSLTLSGTTAIASATAADMVGKLGSDFTTESSAATAYNLMEQSLSSYTYPALTDVGHHGDWNASFKPGALVYYERYSDGTYGFYGANVDSTLKDSPNVTVVGDGYAIVYASSDAMGTRPKSITVTVENGDTEHINIAGSTAGYSVSSGAEEYTLYPLSKANCNLTRVPSDFYLKVTIVNDTTHSTDYYYFNPHFAKTAIETTATAAKPTFGTGSEINVRTARHLYNMSLYYDTYASATQSATYDQERNIDYSSYSWSGFSLISSCSSQEPIAGGSQPFIAAYNGECNTITNVSFISESGSYVGLFGRVASGASISNVVVTTDYNKASDAVNYRIQRTQAAQANESVWLGILAGYNSGTIRNCAVAGYYLAGTDGTIHGYANSHIYVGNLVGQNDGTILNSEADTPRLNLSTYRTTGYAGGFVGYNSGTIRNCYAVSHLYCVAQSGSTSIAGFAALNTGEITQSYCATALTASGDGTSSYGFSPDDQGVVTSSYYLNTGSYQFVDGLYAYETKTGAAEYRTYEQLVKLNTAPAAASYNHANTDETDYPYRTVVTNAAGQAVHYGEWQLKPELGTLGFFYWEHEEGGDNDGYKLTYIGTAEGKSQYQTTLCTSHDDGGVITEFGYGYYVLNGEEDSVTASYKDASTSGTAVHTAAKASLEQQIPGYTFYPYSTADTAKTAGSSYGDYICFTGTGTTAQCTLTYNSHSYIYAFTPLFANAMQLLSADGKAGASINITDNGGNTTDYSQVPGTANNRYEIRSAKQLQYINWNCGTKTTSELVSTSNYTKFNFLMYASVTGQGTQTYANANGNKTNTDWHQTHDVDGSNVTNFVPIAGNTTSSSNSAYNATLYTWFGGSYDGASYKIQELSIVSSSFTVGVFGVTVGAQIENVILYSEKGAVIERSTSNTDKLGSYALGGLIGVAYDYNSAMNKTITNCAVAGYNIVDASRNQQARGEANVGGLIGVSNVNIDKCSAVTNIKINCTHKNSSGGITLASWGNYIRVGGISGAVQGSVKNSYSGGTISVGSETLDETYTSGNVHVSQTSATQANREHSTNIFLAGIAGSGFAMNYYNFTGNGSLKEGSPTISNCYTYMEFPKMEGTIRAIAMIASVADRFAQGPHVTITNCYYLDSSANIDTSNLPKYYFKTKIDLSSAIKSTVNGRTYLQDMLLGYVNWESKMYGEGLNSSNSISATEKTYTELSSGAVSLGGSFGRVSTTDASGASVSGKYSFPGGDASLNGKNYPFPTVITQKDLSFGNTVNVHYGAWPHDTAFWDEAVATMDIFESMSVDDGYAYSTFILNKGSSGLSELTVDSFTVGETDTTKDDYAEVANVQKTADGESWLVTVKALKTGSTTIQEKTTGESFTLEITANPAVSADPASMLLDDDESAKLTVYAASAKTTASDTNMDTFTVRESPNSNALPDDLDVSSFTVSDTAAAKVTAVSQNDDGESWTVTVTGLAAGTASIKETNSGAVYRVTVTDTGGSLQTECARDYSTDANLIWNLTSSTLASPDGDADVVRKSASVKNVYTVTGFGYDATIYVTADYKYNEVSYTGTCLVTIQRPGCIGVSYTRDEASAYMQADLTAEDSGTVVGKAKTFMEAAPVKPTNADLYLYDTASAGILDYYVDTLVNSSDASEKETIAADGTITIQNSTITITIDGVNTENALTHKLDTSLTQAVGNSYRSVGCQLYEVVPDEGTPSGSVTVTVTVRSESGVVYSFTIDDYPLRVWEDESAAEEDPEAPEDTQYEISFDPNNGSSMEPVLVSAGAASVPDYTAPTRTASAWNLDGWYAAEDNSAEKVLNADGTVVDEDVEGYCSGGALALEEDITLYARWSRQTAAYVLTDELEAGEDYLITTTPNTANKTALLAFGQLSAEDPAYTQSLTAVDPDHETSEYLLYDEDTGATSEINALFVTGVSRNLVWNCSYDGSLYTIGGSIRLNSVGGGSYTASIGDRSYSINIYRKMTVLQTTFADETLDLCLTMDNEGHAYSVKVGDGTWPDWYGYTQPTREGYQFMGWYTSAADGATKVLNENGWFASSYVAGYIENNKWVCKDSSVTLYAKWEELPDEEEDAEEEDETTPSGDDTTSDGDSPQDGPAPTDSSQTGQTEGGTPSETGTGGDSSGAGEP